MKIRNILFVAIVLMAFSGTASALTEISSSTTLPYTMSDAGEIYELTEDLIAESSALIIGADNIIFNGNGHTIIYMNTSSGVGIIATSRDNITIKNVNITQGTAGTTSTHGIKFTSVTGSVVQNCNIDVISGSGLYATTSSDINVVDCVFDSSAYYGSYITGNSAGMDYDNVSCISESRCGIQVDLLATLNNFSCCSFTSTSSYGLRMTGTTSNSFDNCSASSASTHASLINGNSNNMSYTDCVFTSTTGNAVYISDLENNTFIRCTGNSTTAGNGFYIYTDANNCTFTDCIGKAVASGSGIQITSSTGNVLNNCTIYSLDNYGLYLNLATNNSISGGYAYSTNTYGVLISTSTDNTVVNLTCYSVGNDGIYIYSSSNNVFTGLNCISDLTKGIRLKSSTGNTFSDINVDSPLCSNPHTGNHIMLMGDSITNGVGALSNYGGWGKTLSSELGTSWYVSNRGNSGERADEGLDRLSQEIEIFNPDFVTIMYGTNDLNAARTQQDIIDDIIAMAEMSEISGAKPIIILTTPTSLETNSQWIALNENLTTQSNIAGYEIINAYDALDTDPYNAEYDDGNVTNLQDTVHPTDAANIILGTFISRNFQAMTSLISGTGITNTISSDGTVIQNRDTYPTDHLVIFSVSTWTTNSKTWTESSETHDITTSHIIGDFPANVDIEIYTDGVLYDRVTSNSAGVITWVYDGGFGEHEFGAYVVSDFEGASEEGADTWSSGIAVLEVTLLIMAVGVIIGGLKGQISMDVAIKFTLGLVAIMVIVYMGAGLGSLLDDVF